MLKNESDESKPSRRVERQGKRTRQPRNVRLGVFLTASDADTLDQEAQSNGLSVSAYLSRLLAKGRQALISESEARAAEAEARRRRPPENSFEHAVRLAEEEELRRRQGDANARLIAATTVRGRIR